MLRTPVEKLKIINFREDVQNKIKYAKANSSNVYDRKFFFFWLLLNFNVLMNLEFSHKQIICLLEIWLTKLHKNYQMLRKLRFFQ